MCVRTNQTSRDKTPISEMKNSLNRMNRLDLAMQKKNKWIWNSSNRKPQGKIESEKWKEYHAVMG